MAVSYTHLDAFHGSILIFAHPLGHIGRHVAGVIVVQRLQRAGDEGLNEFLGRRQVAVVLLLSLIHIYVAAIEQMALSDKTLQATIAGKDTEFVSAVRLTAGEARYWQRCV